MEKEVREGKVEREKVRANKDNQRKMKESKHRNNYAGILRIKESYRTDRIGRQRRIYLFMYINIRRTDTMGLMKRNAREI